MLEEVKVEMIVKTITVWIIYNVRILILGVKITMKKIEQLLKIIKIV